MVAVRNDEMTMREPETKLFEKSFEVRWADCDPNQHLRHSAYTDYATHVRLTYLEHEGFDLSRFDEEHFGPVIFREEIRFLREVLHRDTITINFKAEGFSDDGMRWRVFHEVKNQKGKRAALIVLDGGWLCRRTRKLLKPHKDIQAIMDRLVVQKVPNYRLLG